MKRYGQSSIDLGPADGSRHAARDSAVADAERTPGIGVDIAGTLDWARRTSCGSTALTAAERWELIAGASFVDVAAARILEPHLDALEILRESRVEGPAVDVGADASATWGVFAAEAAGMRLDATSEGDTWTLDGTKPWCSLAGALSHALVTAWVGTDRQLFAVDLRDPGVRARSGPWSARGLTQVVSAPTDFEHVRAVPVGSRDWYLTRPGFSWGGVGVAAAWWGGLAPLLSELERAAERPDADQLSAAHLGHADSVWWAARCALSDAATRTTDLTAEPAVVAQRVRTIVADAVERITSLAERALGPGPLTIDERLGRRIADLRIYVRQHHADRDHALLGRELVAR